MTTRPLASLALLAITAAAARAQSTDAVLLTANSGSRVWVSGTSTLHDFTCKATQVTAQVAVDSKAANSSAPVAHPVLATEVTVPVKGLKCGHGKMDDNMYKTLRATTYPTISYKLGTADVVAGSTSDDSITVRAVGSLTIVGQEKSISMDIAARRAPDGGFRGSATVPLRLSDFGIKPPAFMMGTIKVGDAITVGFDVLLTPATAVAAAAGVGSH